MKDRIHVYVDAAGEYRWKRVAPNGKTVADSGEGYIERDSAVEAAHREAGDTAEVVVRDE